jgi:hypothetical protein
MRHALSMRSVESWPWKMSCRTRPTTTVGFFGGMCLLEHAHRREHHSGSTDPPILDGLPLPRTAGPPFRTCEPVSLTPPPTPCGEGTDDQDMFVDCARPEDGDP